MAGKMKPLSAILIIAALLVAAVGGAEEAAIGCGTVLSTLAPCIPYITDRGAIGECCNGIKTLHESAKTTADRQEVCGCLKKLAIGFPNINYEKAAELPKKCGVDIPYVISPDIDCSKYVYMFLFVSYDYSELIKT